MDRKVCTLDTCRAYGKHGPKGMYIGYL